MMKKLSQAFDFQRFQQNPRLAKIIGEAESRYANALSDDDLELVSAAGDAPAPAPIHIGANVVNENSREDSTL